MLRAHLEGQTRKEHVELDVAEAHLDDGHERVLDGAQVADVGLAAQQLQEGGEEVAALHVARRHAQRVNVGALGVHAQAVRAEREHLAAHRGRHVVGHAFGQAHLCQRSIDWLRFRSPPPQNQKKTKNRFLTGKIISLSDIIGVS